MTREEAIEVMKAYRDKVINSVSNQLDGDIKAFNMAIRALSQEPPENIREEIASHIGGCGFLNDGLDLALEIIDKHIESEDKGCGKKY